MSFSCCGATYSATSCALITIVRCASSQVRDLSEDDQLLFLLYGMVSRSLSVTSECVGSVLVSFLLFLLEPEAE